MSKMVAHKSLRAWTAALLMVAFTFGAPGAQIAHAASFTVTNTNDSGAGSLRQAILDANAAAGADTITFDVSDTIILASTLPAITDPDGLTIDGTGQNITISGNNAVQVMSVAFGATLNLKALTIANGNPPCIPDPTCTRAGGGIYNEGTLTVADSAFSGNSAGTGGGIHNEGTLTISDSTFSGNSAGPGIGAGGGIYNEGALTISASIFSGNSADLGGSILNFSNTLTTVTNSTFSSNSAERGGGILNNGPLTVIDSTFSGNSALNLGGPGVGGGIEHVAGTLTVTGSTFSSNSASRFGGGIFGGTVTVTNSSFFGNSAENGGGIWHSGFDSGGPLAVTHTTFSGNTANIGGGIFTQGPEGTLTLKNTIIANSPLGGNCFGPISDGGGNLSYPDTACPGINADPMLGPLADNGGATQTLALQAGSPAIDAAVDANCPATDQRGVIRPQGAHCDIGAFEVEVPGFNFGGFLPPLNGDAVNQVKAGQGVPVKFSLGGDFGLDIFASGYPKFIFTECEPADPVDPIVETVSAGQSGLSYDAETGEYTYVWRTNKNWAGKCGTLTLKFTDGSEYSASFKFTK